MLTRFKLFITNFHQMVLDIAWGGSEGSLLKWEDVNINWENMDG